MIWYHGDKRLKSYFEGWYLKCQTKDGQCLALIPAIHIDGDGCKAASIQVITENQSWWLHFPGDLFHAESEHFLVQIDGNVFSKHGVELAIHEDGIDLVGKIRFAHSNRFVIRSWDRLSSFLKWSVPMVSSA